MIAQKHDQLPLDFDTLKDSTIRAQFDTYRFADHVAHVADLLARVCTVSVQTMAIVDALAAQSPLRSTQV